MWVLPGSSSAASSRIHLFNYPLRQPPPPPLAPPALPPVSAPPPPPPARSPARLPAPARALRAPLALPQAALLALQATPPPAGRAARAISRASRICHPAMWIRLRCLAARLSVWAARSTGVRSSFTTRLRITGCLNLSGIPRRTLGGRASRCNRFREAASPVKRANPDLASLDLASRLSIRIQPRRLLRLHRKTRLHRIAGAFAGIGAGSAVLAVGAVGGALVFGSANPAGAAAFCF